MFMALGWVLLSACGPIQPSAAEAKVLAVRSELPELKEALGKGVLQRWILPEEDHLKLEVGPEANGEITVEVHTFPVSEALKKRLENLPITLEDQTIVLGDTRYDGATNALGLRLPESETSRFLVLGQDVSLLAQLADQILVAASGYRWHSLPENIDYLLWEHRWSHRSGRWQKSEAGYTLAPDERDDPKDRESVYNRLVPIERQHLLLRVPTDHNREAMNQLADQLDTSIAEMAERVPIELETPIEILIEDNYYVQGRHLAEIGQAVLRKDGRLHIVYDPRDLDLYRYELARALIRRAGGKLSPWFEDGAALWLARDWYGRRFEAWLPDLAFARVLPTPAQLLADERQAGASTVLWPIVSAGILERISGKSLASKLLTPPNEATVRSILIRHLNGAHLRSVPVEEEEAEKRNGETDVADESSETAEPPPEPPLPFYRGISFAMANGLEIGYHGPGIDAQLARFAELGADSVSLMPFAYQPRPDEAEMRFLNRSPVSETDVGVIHAARRSRANGFTVLWKPHIWVSHNSWPGDIAMTDEREWQTWWLNYRTYLLHHAILAQFTESELFAIGVELGRTVEREDDWRHLINSIRRIYEGQLTYAGNWWDDYEKVPFWDALDFIGVDAYFPLASAKEAKLEQKIAGARKAIEQMQAISQRTGKNVLLTEVGYAAQKAAWIEPHAEGGTFDEADQRASYEAFLKALGRPGWLSGLYVWKAFSHEKVEGGTRPDFRFLGREAEAVVSRYFKNSDQPVNVQATDVQTTSQ